MGFDMYWHTPPSDEELATNPDAGHFRLNIFAMGDTLEAMYAVGMLDTDAVSAPFPTAEAFGLSERPRLHDDEGDRIEHPINTPEGMYQRALVAVISGDSGRRIPVYKLQSNDGWRVTPEEIERSLAIYDELYPDRNEQPKTLEVELHGQTVLLDWWGEWVEWLRTSREHDGFGVY